MESTKEYITRRDFRDTLSEKSQTPTWTTCSGIAWLVKDIKVTERSVREVLDWLVKNDLVLCQADKYQISKREFIEMSKRKKIQEREMNTQESVQENADVHTPSFQSENDVKEWMAEMYRKIIFFVCYSIGGIFIERHTYWYFVFQPLCP